MYQFIYLHLILNLRYKFISSLFFFKLLLPFKQILARNFIADKTCQLLNLQTNNIFNCVDLAQHLSNEWLQVHINKEWKSKLLWCYYSMAVQRPLLNISHDSHRGKVFAPWTWITNQYNETIGPLKGWFNSKEFFFLHN